MFWTQGPYTIVVRSDPSHEATTVETAAQVTVRAAEAGEALRTSAARYRTLFDSIDEGFCIIEVIFEDERAVDYRFIETNPAFVQQTGLTDAVGRTMRELAPAHEAHWYEIYGGVAVTGEPKRFEAPAAALGRWYDVYAFRIDDPAECHVAILFADVARRKRAEARLRSSEARHTFLLALSDALRPQTDPDAIRETAARLLARHLSAARVHYMDAGADDDTLIAGPCFADGVPPITGVVLHVSDFDDAALAAYRLGRSYVDADTAGTVRSEAQRAGLDALGIRAFVGVPLAKRGRLIGVLGVHDVRPRAWSAEEVMLIEQTAERTWEAVERSRAEAALRETQQRLDDALSTARMAHWHWDPATDNIVGSPSMDELFGLHPGQRIETSEQMFALVHPEDREQHRALVESARARGEGWHAEFCVIRPRDGDVVWLEEVATVAHDTGTALPRTTGLVWDITGRKQSESAAARERATRDRDVVRRQLLEVEEAERRRLARELHDEVGQHLTAIGLGLHALSDVAAPGSEVDRRTAYLRSLVDAMGKSLHTVAVRLRPKALDDFGLEAALAAYVEEWSRQTGIAVEAHTRPGAERLPSVLEGALYRVVQEALTNVARHSNAMRASIVVERHDDYVLAVVGDDGRGFDPQRVTNNQPGRLSGFGLLGIRERVALLGGIVEIESSPGVGAAIFVRIPIDRPSGKVDQSGCSDV